MSLSITHSAWKPGAFNVSGAVYYPTPTLVSDMVISWEFFRGENVISHKTHNLGGTYSTVYKSLNDSPSDGNIMGNVLGANNGELSGTPPNSYYGSSGNNNFLIGLTQSGGSYPAGTTTLSQVDNENFLDFTGSGTSITAGDTKTFTQIIEIDTLPDPGDLSHIAGTRLGTNGWRVYIDNLGSISFQYWQYRSPFGTMRSDLLDVETLSVGQKYMITVVATASGTNKLYISNASNNNTTPYTVNVSRMGWASFAPNNIRLGNIYSNISTQFQGRFYGIWAWDRELTDAQVGTLYTDLQTAGAI